MMTKHILLGTILAMAACKSGPDPAVRTAISQKLESAQPGIQACYQKSLTTNRKLRGMVVAQMAVLDTGQFTEISFRRDEPNDPVLRFCVTQQPAQPKLDKPPGQRIQLDSVPIKFEWANPGGE